MSWLLYICMDGKGSARELWAAEHRAGRVICWSVRVHLELFLSKFSCQEFETSWLPCHESLLFLLICGALMQGEERMDTVLCRNREERMDTVLCRNDQDAGMQPVKPGQHPAWVTLLVSCVYELIQKSHTLEVDKAAQWTLVPTHGQALQAEVKVSTECCRWDWTARMNLFVGSLELPLENVVLLLECCSASNFRQKASRRNKTSEQLD